jgi:hypothetical protein
VLKSDVPLIRQNASGESSVITGHPVHCAVATPKGWGSIHPREAFTGWEKEHVPFEPVTMGRRGLVLSIVAGKEAQEEVERRHIVRAVI